MRRQVLIALAGIAALLLARNLYVMLLVLPDEVEQKAIFRIIFFHVPAAWTAFLCFFAALVASVLYLARKDLRYDAFAVSVTEVGLAFGLVNLATGMIWGSNFWGSAWAWDARLTSMLVGCLIYAGYLMLRHAVEDPTERAKNSAVLSIFAFVDVPIVFFSIKWWRMLHPPPVVWGGGFMSRPYWNMLLGNWAPLLLLAFVLLMIRMRQEQQQREIETLRRLAHSFQGG